MLLTASGEKTTLLNKKMQISYRFPLSASVFTFTDRRILKEDKVLKCIYMREAPSSVILSPMSLNGSR
jgi:hypothetical protein